MKKDQKSETAKGLKLYTRSGKSIKLLYNGIGYFMVDESGDKISISTKTDTLRGELEKAILIPLLDIGRIFCKYGLEDDEILFLSSLFDKVCESVENRLFEIADALTNKFGDIELHMSDTRAFGLLQGEVLDVVIRRPKEQENTMTVLNIKKQTPNSTSKKKPAKKKAA